MTGTQRNSPLAQVAELLPGRRTPRAAAEGPAGSGAHRRHRGAAGARGGGG